MLLEEGPAGHLVYLERINEPEREQIIINILSFSHSCAMAIDFLFSAEMRRRGEERNEERACQ
jgi:hypothetical protein